MRFPTQTTSHQEEERGVFLDKNNKADRKIRRDRVVVLEKNSMAFEVEISELLESVDGELKQQLGLADEIVGSTKETIEFSGDSNTATTKMVEIAKEGAEGSQRHSLLLGSLEPVSSSKAKG